jgi:hypothetical protein
MNKSTQPLDDSSRQGVTKPTADEDATFFSHLEEIAMQIGYTRLLEHQWFDPFARRLITKDELMDRIKTILAYHEEQTNNNQRNELRN